MVAAELAQRWELPRARERYRGRLREGRAGPGGPRVALIEPLTYMNDAGRSVGPARGTYRLDLDRVLVVHDEIDLPFGEVRTRLGGGLAEPGEDVRGDDLGIGRVGPADRLSPAMGDAASATSSRPHPDQN